MKTKRTLTMATVLVALAALLTLGIFHGTRRAQAQDVSPPTPDRISFGMVGITHTNLRTVFYVGNPGVIRGFNPQPDPPLGQ